MKLRALFAVAIIAAIPFLNGCATPAASGAMTVSPGVAEPVNAVLKGNMGIASVIGGKDTNPLWMSKVDNVQFKKALQDSLAKSGYLAPSGAQARYQVSAEMFDLDQPLLGFTMEVVSKVTYKVSGEGRERSYPIQAVGSATVSDAFLGVERLRMANERSAFENIRAFLKALISFPD